MNNNLLKHKCNDGSNDKTGEIAQTYVENNLHFKLYNKKMEDLVIKKFWNFKI